MIFHSYVSLPEGYSRQNDRSGDVVADHFTEQNSLSRDAESYPF